MLIKTRFTIRERLTLIIGSGLFLPVLGCIIIAASFPEVRPIISGTEVLGVIEYKNQKTRRRTSYRIGYSFPIQDINLRPQTSKGSHYVNRAFYKKVQVGDVVPVVYHLNEPPRRRLRSYVKGARRTLLETLVLLSGVFCLLFGVLSLYLVAVSKKFRRKNESPI